MQRRLTSAPVWVARVLLAGATVVATAWLGWPAPAVIGAATGGLAPASVATTPARDSAVGAVLGWAVMLVWAGRGGRAATVTRMLSGLAGVHGPAAVAVGALLVVLTLALSAVLAWSAATLVAGLLSLVRASNPGRVTLSGTSERPPAAQTP